MSLYDLYVLVTGAWWGVPLSLSVLLGGGGAGIGAFKSRNCYYRDDKIFFPIVSSIFGLGVSVIIWAMCADNNDRNLKIQKARIIYESVLKNPVTVEEVNIEDNMMKIKVSYGGTFYSFDSEAEKIPHKGEKWSLKLDKDNLMLNKQEDENATK